MGGGLFSADPGSHLVGAHLLDKVSCFTLGLFNFGRPPCVDGGRFRVTGGVLEFLEPHLVNPADQSAGEFKAKPVLGLPFDLRLPPLLFGDEPVRRGRQQILDLTRRDVARLDGTDLDSETGGGSLAVAEVTLPRALQAASFTGLDQPARRVVLDRLDTPSRGGLPAVLAQRCTGDAQLLGSALQLPHLRPGAHHAPASPIAWHLAARHRQPPAGRCRVGRIRQPSMPGSVRSGGRIQPGRAAGTDRRPASGERPSLLHLREERVHSCG